MEINYITIYDFNVIEEIRKGETVYSIDKLTQQVENVNELEVADLCECLNTSDKETGRFEFYKIKKVEDIEK